MSRIGEHRILEMELKMKNNLKSVLGVITLPLTMMIATSAHASTYSCGVIDGPDSAWALTITVDEGKNEIDFFDNDHNSILHFYGMTLKESSPPQRILKYAGVDKIDSARKLGASFNATKLEATLTDDVDGPHEKDFHFKCE